MVCCVMGIFVLLTQCASWLCRLGVMLEMCHDTRRLELPLVLIVSQHLVRLSATRCIIDTTLAPHAQHISSANIRQLIQLHDCVTENQHMACRPSRRGNYAAPGGLMLQRSDCASDCMHIYVAFSTHICAYNACMCFSRHNRISLKCLWL